MRLIMADFSDESDQVQNDYLSGELEKILQEVPYGQRRRFLEALNERFPLVTGMRSGDSVPEGASPDPGLDPDALLEAVVKILPDLDEDKRNAFLQRIQPIHGTARGIAGIPDDLLKRARAILRLDENADIHPERLLELSIALAEFTVKLQQLITGVWGKISPRSRVKPSRRLREITGDYVVSRDNDFEPLKQELILLLQLTTAIVTGISRSGEEFARRCSHRFSPESIQGLIDMEQQGIISGLVSKEVKCWRKYKELAEALTQDAVQKDIEDAIGNYAEAFIRGMERLG